MTRVLECNATSAESEVELRFIGPLDYFISVRLNCRFSAWNIFEFCQTYTFRDRALKTTWTSIRKRCIHFLRGTSGRLDPRAQNWYFVNITTQLFRPLLKNETECKKSSQKAVPGSQAGRHKVYDGARLDFKPSVLPFWLTRSFSIRCQVHQRLGRAPVFALRISIRGPRARQPSPQQVPTFPCLSWGNTLHQRRSLL